MGGSVDAPEPTAEQKALERLQRMELNEEKAASERRLKSIAQKKIGKKSLLGSPVSTPSSFDPAGTITEKYTKTDSGILKTKRPGRLGGMR